MTHEDFPAFFEALHDYPPFPWQADLARYVATVGRWPKDVDLPTASGKTAAIDVAIFDLALDVGRPKGQPRRAALRTFFVIDRRIVVDEAARRARKIACKLQAALADPEASDILREVARRLLVISGGDSSPDGGPRPRPLGVATLRGGMYRDDSWAQSPAQPVVCVATVDQVGSRLLFRGYGLGRSGRLVHAGLVGTDSLIILDEAHLSRPFLQTLDAVRSYRAEGRPAWGDRGPGLPFHVVQMTATPERGRADLSLTQRDRDNAELGRRLRASKLAELVEVPVGRDSERNRQVLAGRIVEGTLALVRDLRDRAKLPAAPVAGIVVNRVETARDIFTVLKAAESGDVILLTGRIRPIDRDRLLKDNLDRMKAGRDRSIATERPLFVVATQTIEVGADLDFDALVTEAAPLDALRQRFGRLDRLGRLGKSRALIVARKDTVAPNADDPIYGGATATTWAWLGDLADRHGGDGRLVDFGVDALARHIPADAGHLRRLNSPKPSAPVLLPAHIDAWAQTDPIPAPDPDVAFFLHGPQRPADVQVVWRADLPAEELKALARLPRGAAQQRIADLGARCASIVALVPPSSLEAMPVPAPAAAAWLAETAPAAVADVEGQREEIEESRGRPPGRFALRWRGPEDSALIRADEVRPGDTLVVPSEYGGADEHGWDPGSTAPVSDLGDHAALRARGRPVLRIHPRVIERWSPSPPDGQRPHAEAIASLLSGGTTETDKDPDELARPQAEVILEQIRAWPDLPDWARLTCDVLAEGAFKQVSYPSDEARRPLVLIGRRRVRDLKDLRGEDDNEPDEAPADDDAASFRTAKPVALVDHCRGVAGLAAAFATAIGLPEALVRDLTLAGRLHDVGKADPRFQVMLHGGDEVEAALADEPLAKSALPSQDRDAFRRARERSGFPPGARHEAISVALARSEPGLLAAAADPDLVLHLIGTHHGRGRPFWPVVPDDEAPLVTSDLDGLTLLASARHGLERLDSGWTDRFWGLVRRHGPWGLAFLEAVLILADHRRSHDEQEAQP